MMRATIHACALRRASKRIAPVAMFLALAGCFDGIANQSTGGAGGGVITTTTGSGGSTVSGSGGAASGGNGGGGGVTCTPGQTGPCYSGPAGTEGVGICKRGTQTCDAHGVFSGPCVGEVLPQTETCNTPFDDDCNGQTNEGGAGCVCVPGEMESCYTGPIGTLGVGICSNGTRTCNDQGTAFDPCEGDITPEPEGCLDSVDNDCNGEINEDGAGCICTPGEVVTCYTGPPATRNVGACKAGTKTCNAQGSAFGACNGEITPQPETCNTPVDDDCNGQTNEAGLGCVCVPGSVASCYGGPSGTLGVGACKAGTKTCAASGLAYGPCLGEVQPTPENCFDAVDNDCNGQVNEGGPGCVCAPNAIVPCYNGPLGTLNVGICKAGTATCNALGSAVGPCSAEVLPQTENCFNGVDDNCDGQTNEDCACTAGDVVSCYTGPAGTLGVGACAAGTRTCDGATNSYGPCVGDVTPQAETCLDLIDNDCNGQVNEGGVGCVCTPNATTSCYTGPLGTQGVGVCAPGTHTCNAQGTSYGPCTGEVLPQAETCLDLVDNDCNGQVNEGGAGCVCVPASTRTCYSGLVGTAGVGACKSGIETCNAQGIGYGLCVGEVVPQPETCNTPVDDDCNGQVNEGGVGCVCVPNATRPCYSGPAGTQGVGICVGGVQACNGLGTAWGACAGEITPQPEDCSTLVDEDCDGNAPLCGPLLWAQGFGGLVDQEGMCVASDATGNVIIGGYTASAIDFGCGLQASAAGDSPFLAKFDGAGNCLWSHVFAVPTVGITAQIKAVTADASGNVYAGITFFGTVDAGGGPLVSGGTSDIGIAKFNASGVHQWSQRYGNAFPQTLNGITTDSAGNVILAGYFAGAIDLGGGSMTSAGGNDIFVGKLSPSGTHIWSSRFGNSANQIATAVAVDGANNVLLSGAFAGTVDFGGGVLTTTVLGDAFAAKFGPTGNHIWSKAFASSAGDDGANGIATDAAGNVYIAGIFGAGTINFGGATFTNQGGNDVWVAKLDPAGNHVWSRAAGAAGNQGALSLAADQSGNVAIGGPFDQSADFGGGTLTSAGSSDMFVAKYSTTGSFLWAKRFGGANSEFPRALTMDPTGNVFATGLCNSAVDFGAGLVAGAGGEDIFLVKLGP